MLLHGVDLPLPWLPVPVVFSWCRPSFCVGEILSLAYNGVDLPLALEKFKTLQKARKEAKCAPECKHNDLGGNGTERARRVDGKELPDV